MPPCRETASLVLLLVAVELLVIGEEVRVSVGLPRVAGIGALLDALRPPAVRHSSPSLSSSRRICHPSLPLTIARQFEPPSPPTTAAKR